ncbi:MAG TPA: methyltransferase domain-containing protein [Oligoflexus sp.]|uniref:class I SAM-dependent methyltransferase n=1 Tax=Oligoflexus sp. TaxID=1971216 RepID=UPI002D7E4645|nr:methyltransferase domain-containing protein [Oligoflexus sp.]HET9236846.1 methyltransferase domain-containing protein [Oligoflexus sp.]
MNNRSMNNRFTIKSVAVAQERFELELFADLDREFSAHFDELSDPAKDLPEPPLFGSLWPAAEGLANYLLQKDWPLRGQRVLEIGCGLGLPSLLCAKLGAQVETMDHHPGVASLLARNCQRNKLKTLTFHLASFQNTSARLGTFDLIIGSDILYEPDLYPKLEDFILRHAAQKCLIIIADPGRYAVSRFGSSLKTKGQYKLEKLMISGHELPIEIHSFQLTR